MTIVSLIPIPWPFNRSAALPVLPLPSTAGTSNDAHLIPLWLRHYSTPGVSPPSARIDPRLKPREARPIRFWDVWKYGVVVAAKATEMSIDVLKFYIRGPERKSWGIEMTLINSLMKGAARHSALVDIGTVRMLMGLGGLVPIPSDALVTPVTFRVQRRGLRGILADLDSKETGFRELSGEWVVGKRTWQRLQSEWRAARKVQVQGTNNETKYHRKKERVILYIHGGAYYLSSAAAQRLISIPLSKYTDARVFALDYRLAPETRFPGPLHDAVAAYLRLVEDLHIPAENIIVSGDSAGGGLALALMMYLRDESYPMPGGAILMSPWVDLTMSCESWDSNARFDVLPAPVPDNYLNPVSLYLGDHMEEYITHPYASPLFGNFKGLPPLLIQAGDAELLRDEITLLAHKASLAGVEVRHELYEDAVHVFQAYPFLSSAVRAFMSCRDFVQNVLPAIQSASPQILDVAAEAEMELEIENENATVVRGDGVETATGMEEVKEELGDSDRTESESDEDSLPVSQATLPSWGRSHTWTPPLVSDEDEDEEVEKPVKPKQERRSHSHSRSETLPTIRRIRSAISLIMPEPIAVSRPRYHQRTRSNQSRYNDPCRSPAAATTNDYRRMGHYSPGSLRLPVFSISDFESRESLPIPSPSIRRSNVSHPDIASLVDDFTATGPANETMLFKA